MPPGPRVTSRIWPALLQTNLKDLLKCCTSEQVPTAFQSRSVTEVFRAFQSHS
jgi:hypothetical protein